MHRDVTAKIADVARTYARERDYWLKQLSGELVKNFFPYDNKRTRGQTGDEPLPKGIMEFQIKDDLFSRLTALSTGSHHTLHVILIAVLTLLLSKYTGNRDIILGTPVYKQDRDEDFVNTVLALRDQIKPVMTFKELLLQVKDTLLEAHDQQNYPLESLAAELNPGYASSNQDFPLFDVTLLLENIHDKRYLQHIRHNMTFCFLRHETFLESRVEYNPVHYREHTIKQIINHFMKVLNVVLFQPDLPLSGIDILSGEEKKALLVDFNERETEFPVDNTLHELFMDQVQRTPDHVALVAIHETHEKHQKNYNMSHLSHMSYKVLNQKSHQLAHILVEKGVQPDTIVGLMIERSIEMIIAILGILKAGGAYLPIDPSYPQERIDYMLSDSGAKILLTRQEIAGLSSPEAFNIGPKGASFHLHLSPWVNAPVTSLAYLIYTSGTTGRPKGVMLEHRGVVNYICWAARTYVKNETTAFPLYTSISFDLTVTSIFTPLLTGNAIYIYKGEEGEPLLDRIIEDNRVGIVKLTPAHLRLIKEAGKRPAYPGSSGIKRFILGGENLETQLAREIHDLWQGKIEIYNEYGPTETVVGSMIHRFDPGKDLYESVSIGVPIANTRVYLLDSDMNPVPIGVPGEIYIGGTGLGRGYLNNPELTAEKFTPRTNFYKKFFGGSRGAIFQKSPPGRRRQKLYKTGDLARRYEDGTIEFLGRMDQQVKIRGFRVEVGEIEHQLKQFRKQEHTTSILEEPLSKAGDVQGIVRCTRCLVSAGHPGIHFDSQGVCNICREYEGYEDHVKNYFKTPGQLQQLLETGKRPGAQYDCLLLFSGGKDSTYVLYRLIERGLKVLTFTFDNGYISRAAFENIRRTTSALKVDHIVGKAEQMNRVFVESLAFNNSVCHGCWNAVNAYGTKIAHEKGINLVISGLSRGQIFEMRLQGLFQAGIFAEKEIDEKLLLFRKGFHSRENKFARILGMVLEEKVVESIQFIDFFRYDDTKVEEIKEYLFSKGWVQPQDTGFCSSNCLINDVGIYMHLKAQGVHFYEAPLSWDVRLGQITREAGLEEIGFSPQPLQVDRILREIGFYNDTRIKDAVVLDKTDKNNNKYLCGYVVSDRELNSRELRDHLAAKLPEYMIPSYFVQVEKIPLSAGGKVDRKALIALETESQRLSAGAAYVPPADEKEILVANIFKELLNLDQVGINDNFFELGATSFEIIQVNHQLSREFARDIPVIKFFEYPTITSLLQYLQGEDTSLKEAKEEIKREEAMEKGKARFDQRRKMRR